MTIDNECKKLDNEVSELIDGYQKEADIKTNYWTGKTWDKFFGKICDFLRYKQYQIWQQITD
jgi:hypothetical protein